MQIQSSDFRHIWIFAELELWNPNMSLGDLLPTKQ